MYQMGLCEDDSQELNKIQALLDAYKLAHQHQEFVVRQFTSIESLMTEYKKQDSFDLLLLDIYLPEKTGIEGAKELRENGFDGSIIFLTTSIEYALEAFRVNAVQYLVKPLCQKDFSDALNKAFGQIAEKRHRYIALRIEGKLRRIAVHDIVCSEAQNQYQCLHLVSNEKLRVRQTRRELYELISDFSDFVCVGSAYIINLCHVESLTAKAINLDNGKMLWLPRGAYSKLKEQYFKFYCSEH